MINWIKKKLATISLAMGNVEKNITSQNGVDLGSDSKIVQRNTQGQLMDALKQGEITEEVKDLRWRTYKILKNSESLSSQIVGYDSDNMPIVKTNKKNVKKTLKKIKLDEHDDYPLELSLDNSDIVIGGDEAMENEYISLFDEIVKNEDSDGEVISASHGSISSDEYFATNKTEKPIKISRKSLPNFYIENYTKKLNIRKIERKKRLLEFYISKYPDEYNRTSRLMLSEIKKIIEGQKNSTMIDFDSVEFISYKTIGCNDFLKYEYKITSFDKIIEFNGCYVLKFNADVIVNGRDILETYKQEDLENKYKNKEKK
jgi:hypothetical protein